MRTKDTYRELAPENPRPRGHDDQPPHSGHVGSTLSMADILAVPTRQCSAWMQPIHTGRIRPLHPQQGSRGGWRICRAGGEGIHPPRMAAHLLLRQREALRAHQPSRPGAEFSTGPSAMGFPLPLEWHSPPDGGAEARIIVVMSDGTATRAPPGSRSCSPRSRASTT